MDNRRVIICRGIQGSGKSTWAKRFVKEQGSDKWIRINRDDIRRSLGEYWIESRESLVTNIQDATFKSAMDKGYNIVVDNMNLGATTIEKLNKQIANNNETNKKFQYTAEFKDFFISLDEAIERDSLRDEPIGAKIIKATYNRHRDIFQAKQVERPELQQEEFYPSGNKKPRAIIVDLDGTLALNKTNRPFFGGDFEERLLEDSPNQPVIEFVKKYTWDADTDLIIMSGREGTPKAIENSLKWVNDMDLYPFEMFFRNIGDYRPDEVIKEELLREKVLPKYYIEFVVDDRDKVVDMWRRVGLLCLQVWYGKF